MDTTKAFDSFENKLKDLENTINDCNAILISDNPVSFIYRNANFLTKSFLISLCGYLETYLKDVLEILLAEYNERLKKESLPYNLVRWNIESKQNSSGKVSTLLEQKNCRYENFDIKIKKKDLESFISGNPFRTKSLFEMFGIDLNLSSHFNCNKDIINTIVTKRNNVLHHNDEASDLSNDDVIQQLNEVKNYVLEIDKIVGSQITKCQQRT